jgi:hypothetical protein
VARTNFLATCALIPSVTHVGVAALSKAFALVFIAACIDVGFLEEVAYNIPIFNIQVEIILRGRCQLLGRGGWLPSFI